MKKVLILTLCTVLLALTVIPVTADSDVQIYNLSALGDNALVFTAQSAAAFWEKPTLKAGEYTTTTGTLIVRNSTTTEQKIGLRTVELPYENEEALRYLNHVYITVKNDSTILYEGAYSRINEDRGFSLNTELPPNAEATFFIDLRCDYTYSGDGMAPDDLIKWEFYAVEETAGKVESASFSDSTLLEVLAACIIAAALLGGIVLYDWFMKKR